MTKIYIDADGCAVKDEVYRVAERYKLPVILVANKPSFNFANEPSFENGCGERQF